MKKLLTILLLASMTFTMSSCESWLDVNKNEDAPDYVSEELYLAGLLSAYQSIYWDIRALGPLTQMMGTGSSTFKWLAFHDYLSTSDSSGEIWKLVYFWQGYNLENMINQSLKNESYRLAGIGYAIKAFSWDLLTKYHGEAPMKQAYVTGLLSHDYDYQPEIMAQVREWALTAIEYLEMEDNTNYGNKLKENDLIYAGDPAKWIKFAHSVIVRNLAALTNKTDFAASYAQDLIDHAALAMQSVEDDATVMTLGGGSQALYSAYNNFWGVSRANLTRTYYQHDFAVQVMTGTVPMYNEVTGDKILPAKATKYRPFALNPKQIITDTLVNEQGHFDPRMVAKLGTASDPYYKHVKDLNEIKKFQYIGGNFNSTTGPTGTVPSYFGRNASSNEGYDGNGRWLYRNDAPYILMNAAEIQFCLAETYWKLNKKSEARAAWEKGVALDLEFTAKYLTPGSYAGSDITGGAKPGGDHITKELFDQAAAEYLAGPFVKALPADEFSLSHIMMQKWVALYPWGAPEAWVDMRKYHYDIKYTGDYPSENNGFTVTYVDQKWDSDPTKVYKGLYMQPAQVQNRKTKYGNDNLGGSPCYRVRPRYNSEYMWNKPSLNALKPIRGTAKNYHTSMPWFAYPGDYPASLPELL